MLIVYNSLIRLSCHEENVFGDVNKFYTGSGEFEVLQFLWNLNEQKIKKLQKSLYKVNLKFFFQEANFTKIKTCIVLFSKYVLFLGYRKSGFNHKSCSLFTSFFRVIITFFS